MKQVLITGAAGLLGQHLVDRLIRRNSKDQNFSVMAIDIADNPFEHSGRLKYLQADLTKFITLTADIEKFNPDYIFNCAAYTDVDGCEKNKRLADDLNIHLVENLLGLPSKRIIHFSTDYVFNGQSGPYSESDSHDPIGYYGRTKLQSEKLLEISKKNYLVIRTNVLYGAGKNIRPNFITWLIDSLRQHKRLRIVTDQFNNPIHAGNLAEAAIESAQLNYSGTIHIAGADYLSRYQIAIKTAEHFKLDSSLISPVKTAELGQIAVRPLRGGLKIDKAKKLLKTKLLGLDEGLNLMGDY